MANFVYSPNTDKHYEKKFTECQSCGEKYISLSSYRWCWDCARKHNREQLMQMEQERKNKN